MSLNGSLGLGVMLEAKDLATGVIQNFGSSLAHVAGLSKEAVAGITANLKTLAMGGAIMGAGIAGLMALGPALDEANAYGKAIKLVATEVDAATFSQSAMKAETRDLADKFAGLPVDEAKALYKAVALGANDAAKSTALMTATNELAVAGDADLSTTLDALGGSLNAYHLQATDAAMVSDAFITAMRDGNTTVGALASSVGRVSAGAHMMGISVQEVLGAVSVMTNKGIDAATAVAYLHGALANIEHPMKQARGEAARLGIDFSAGAVRSKGFVGFLHSITDNAKFGADSLGQLFHSTEGIQAMAMLAGDMGAVDSVMKDMGHSAGATKKAFDIMAEGSDYAIKRFDALKHTTLGLVGEALQPLQARAYELINSLLSGFNKLTPATQGFIVRGFALAATLVTILGGVVALKAGFALLSMGMSATGVSIMGTLLPVVAAMALVGVAFAVLRSAYEQNLGGLATFVDDTSAKARLAWDALGQVFRDGGFSGSVMTELNKAGNGGVKSFVIEVYVWINRLRYFFDQLSEGFSAGLKKAEPAFAEFRVALERLGETFGIVGVDTAANGEAFSAYGTQGKSLGLRLAEVAEVAVHLAAAFLDVLRWSKPLIDAFVDIVKWSADSNGVLSLVRDGLMALAAVKVAQGLEAAIGGLQAVKLAATGANLELLLVVAAIASVAAAYSTLASLDKKYNGHGLKAWAMNAKHNLGITSDEDYWKQRAELGGDEKDQYQSTQTGAEESLRRKSAALALAARNDGTSGSTAGGPVVAAEDAYASQQGQSDTASAIKDLSSSISAQPIEVSVTSPVEIMTPDGEVLASMVAQSQTSSSVRGGLPVGSRR